MICTRLYGGVCRPTRSARCTVASRRQAASTPEAPRQVRSDALITSATQSSMVYSTAYRHRSIQIFRRWRHTPPHARDSRCRGRRHSTARIRRYNFIRSDFVYIYHLYVRQASYMSMPSTFTPFTIQGHAGAARSRPPFIIISEEVIIR